MLATYVFCAIAGGALLALSLFGDFLDGAGAGALEVDGGAETGADAAKLLSLRAMVYGLFGFGASGIVLHLLWSGTRGGTAALVAGAAGLVSGGLASAVFGYLKRSEAGQMPGEESFVGLAGKVTVAVEAGSPGTVSVQRGGRRYRVRARAADLNGGGGSLPEGRPVVVVDMKDGVAVVAPVDAKLLEQ